MYNVLNKAWEKIRVETIDVTKHRNVSGVEFTKEDGFHKIVKTVSKKVEEKKVEPKKAKPLASKKK